MKNKHSIRAAGILLLLVFLVNISSLSSPAAETGMVNQDGTINKEKFDRDWRKYSDFDSLIPMDSKSWEVQQYYEVRDRIKEVKAQIFVLQRDMEIDRLMRIDLRGYKKKLVNNIKVNLLKAFWRLSYVTYQTIKSGKGVGESYAGLFTSAENIKILQNGLQVIQGIKPAADSDLGKNTENVVKLLDESLTIAQDPKKTGEVLFNRMSEQVLGSMPSADLTPEEIEMLKNQHLKNRLIDDVLQNSYRANRERRNQINDLEKLRRQLEEDLARWEAKEKQRVADMLVDEFNKNQQKETGRDEPSDQDNSDAEPGAGVDQSGLMGDWSGSWVITQVHISGPQGEAERQRLVGLAQPIESRVEKDAQGSYVFIDLRNNTRTGANINGSQISMYNENQGIYARYTGLISADERSIAGKVEIGDGSGVRYSGTWEVRKK